MRMIPTELVPGPHVAKQMNEALESVVRACPEQYLWSYNRYKIPLGVAPFGEEKAVKIENQV